MNKNKKDYLVYTIGLQTIVCILLFGVFFGLKKTNSHIYQTLKEQYFDNINYNIQLDDYKPTETTKPVTENNIQTPNKEDDENNDTTVTVTEISLKPQLTAQVLEKNNKDYGVTDENEAPDNVSVAGYTLSQRMFLPLSGEITSGFGFREHPFYSEKKFHAGIDIAASKNTPIYAAFDGKVISSGTGELSGNYVKLQHDNNISTLYCHCEELKVKEGETVKAGQIIATVGSTGMSTGPHLHFELRINNISYDPEAALLGAINEV